MARSRKREPCNLVAFLELRVGHPLRRGQLGDRCSAPPSKRPRADCFMRTRDATASCVRPRYSGNLPVAQGIPQRPTPLCGITARHFRSLRRAVKAYREMHRAAPSATGSDAGQVPRSPDGPGKSNDSGRLLGAAACRAAGALRRIGGMRAPPDPCHPRDTRGRRGHVSHRSGRQGKGSRRTPFPPVRDRQLGCSGRRPATRRAQHRSIALDARHRRCHSARSPPA